MMRMTNWKETTLGEVAEKMFSGGTPSTQCEDFYGGNIPWLRTQEVNFNYIYDTEIKITEEGMKNSSARWTPENTVVIAMYGNSAGRTAFSRMKTTTNQACCNFIADVKKANPLFIYFYLKNKYLELEGLANGGAQQNLSVSILKNFSVIIPPIKEQKEIAGVLSSLDDKIELLREENKMLEATAQAIFKEWFVHFNFPNAEGKPHRSSGGKMIDSELGEIPEGWRVGKMGDVFSLGYGKPMKEENRTGKGYPVYGSNGIVGYHKDFLVKGDGIVVGRKGTMGSVVWIEDNFYPIDTAFYVQDKLGIDKLFFHYLLLKSQNLERVGSDSAVPGLNRNSAYAIGTVIPNIKIVNCFNQCVEPIFSKVKLNNSQIQTLSTLRDTLLPKLMKGELKING